MAKSIRACLKAATAMADEDAAAVVTSLDAYIKAGMPLAQAQTAAVNDLIATVTAERAELVTLLRAQHAPLFEAGSATAAQPQPEPPPAPQKPAAKPKTDRRTLQEKVERPAADSAVLATAGDANAEGSTGELMAEAFMEPKAAPVSQAEPAAPPAAEAEQPAPVAANKQQLDDFGQKLEGAKKDQAPSLREALSDDDIEAQPFSKVWPAAELDAIEDTFAAAVATAARAEVPAKPRVQYKLDRWVEKVQTVRTLAQKVVSGSVTRERMLQEFKDRYALRDFGAKVRLLEKLPRDQWSRIGEVSEAPEAYRYEGDALINPKKVMVPMVRVSIDGKTHWLEGSGVATDHVEAVLDMLGAEAAAKPMQFEVRGREGSYSINKKGDPERRKLKTFTTSKEAFAFIKDNRADLVAEWEGVKDRDNVRETDVRGAENRPRAAEDYRKGADVTPEQFNEAFGFRGVQFGNWVAQGNDKKARQGMLNGAYDALMDLANIVQVPPKALSLNGTLGLAFGARGSGSASAHYEPGNLVINLTKTRGAGTLAHEWFHALDNYFSHKRGKTTMAQARTAKAYRDANYITHRPEPLMVRKDGRGTPVTKTRLEEMRKANPSGGSYLAAENWHVDPKHPAGVRPEVEERFAALVKALDESPMKARASLIDKGKSDGYWSQAIERAARSFENYVIAKMMEKGYHNDYLANVKPAETFSRDKARYPYLMPEEVAPIADAFDSLFGTIETRETDTGTEMMDRGDGFPDTEILPRPDVDEVPAADPEDQRILDQAAKNYRTKQPAAFGTLQLTALPELTKPRDDAPQATKERYAAVQLAQKVFGKRIIFYRANIPFANGFQASWAPGHIFIAESTKRPVMAVLGHELLHGLRNDNPALFNKLSDRLRAVLDNPGAYHEALAKKYADAKINPLNFDKTREELIADIVGDFFTERAFWQQVASGQPTLFGKILKAVRDFLNTVLAKLQSARPYGTERYLSDVRAARDIVAEIMGDYAASAQAGQRTGPVYAEAEAMSAAEDQTETPEFRRWFGDSKVVDDRGKPLVVYHGTAQDMIGSAFSHDLAKSEGAGFYFSHSPLMKNKATNANDYARNRSGDSPQVMPVYLRMSNPLVTGFTEPMPKGDAAIGQWLERMNKFNRGLDRDKEKFYKQAIRDAKAGGHDGVIIRNVEDVANDAGRRFTDEADVYIALKPEQIKSAIGNRGTFDPANPDISMDLADQPMSLDLNRDNDPRNPAFIRRVGESVINFFGDRTNTPETFNVWHKTIGTQFHKAKISPLFRKVYETGQDFIHDTAAFANRAADLAPTLLPNVERRFSDFWKRMALRGVDTDALASAVFEGTLENRIWTKQELTARGMNARQQGLYRQFREATNKSLDMLVAAEVARTMGADSADIKHLIQTDDLTAFSQAARRRVLDNKDAADQALADVKKAHKAEKTAMDKAHAAEAKIPANTRPPAQSLMQDRHKDAENGLALRQGQERARAERELAKWEDMEFDIADKYEKIENLKANGYAPLMRFGRYTVTVTGQDEDGNPTTEFFGMYESRAEMNAAAREARQDYPEATSVDTGTMDPDAWRAFRGVSPETLAIFGEATGIDKNTEAYQEYLKLATANHSALKRLIHRKGTPGFSKDPTRVLAAFITSNARRSSQMMHFGDLAAAQEEARKSKQGDVAKEARLLAEALQESPEDGETVAAIKALGFTMFLGGSVASAAVNLTQTATTTLPFLSSHSNPARASAEIAKAMTTLRPGGIDPKSALGKALHRANEEGITMPQEMHNLQAEATRNVVNMLPAPLRTSFRRLGYVWGAMFSAAEQINRRIAFVAAFNLASRMSPAELKKAADKGGYDATPFDFAANAVDETQFVYNRGGQSNWAHNPVGSLLLMFKTYSVSYLELFKRLPMREKALMLTMLIAISGISGLFGADDLDDIIDSVGQRLGFDTNAKDWKRKHLNEHLSPQWAAFVESGITGPAGSPIDLGRLGMGNLIPATGLLRKDVQDPAREVFELFGPMGSYATKLLEAARGEPEKAAPVAIANIIKARDMARTGAYRDVKNKTVIETTPADAWVKAAGFQPGVVAQDQRLNRTTAQRNALQKLTEQEIAADITNARFLDDQESEDKAWERLDKWNDRNPDTGIEITEKQLRARLKQMDMTRAERLEKATPKEMRK